MRVLCVSLCQVRVAHGSPAKHSFLAIYMRVAVENEILEESDKESCFTTLTLQNVVLSHKFIVCYDEYFNKSKILSFDFTFKNVYLAFEKIIVGI